MKKSFTVSVIIVVIVAGVAAWWFNREPARDGHYDAALCVAADMMGNTPVTDAAFIDRIHTVIDNENSDYSVSKIEFNQRLAEVSVKRYQSLSPQQKTLAGQNVDSCIKVMATGAADKTNQ